MIFDLIRNLSTGFRVTFLLGSIHTAWRARVSSYVAGIVLSILIIGLFDYARQSPEIYFNSTGAATLGALLFVAVFTAILLCALQSSYARLPNLLTALFSTLPWYLLLIYIVIDFVAPSAAPAGASDQWALRLMSLSFLGLGVGLLFRSIRSAFDKVYKRSYILVTGVVLTLVLIESRFYLDPALFFSYSADEYSQYQDIDQEQTFYRQQSLLANKMGALQRNTLEQTDFYFVGFAGNGGEAIFRSEVTFAEKVIGERFNTYGRSLHLASDLGNLDVEPLATIYNLQTVLQRVGAQMDVAEDVLFLFLTSHGSRDATIDVSLYPFELAALSAPQLKIFLDDAQIKWRIIVISACFSGSFIEDLRDDNTLILTAASADKTSFGCTSDRDLTYFGEALFQDAMSQEEDLLAAFESARTIVEERELAEELEPSKPQLVVGSGILAKLQALGITSP